MTGEKVRCRDLLRVPQDGPCRYARRVYARSCARTLHIDLHFDPNDCAQPPYSKALQQFSASSAFCSAPTVSGDSNGGARNLKAAPISQSGNRSKLGPALRSTRAYVSCRLLASKRFLFRMWQSPPLTLVAGFSKNFTAGEIHQLDTKRRIVPMADLMRYAALVMLPLQSKSG